MSASPMVFRLDEAHVTLPSRVMNLLRHHPYLGRTQVHSTVSHGHVVLSGAVRSYFQKQMAQESLRTLPGVERITNELIVVQ